MKKTLYLLFATSFLLVACSNEEQPSTSSTDTLTTTLDQEVASQSEVTPASEKVTEFLVGKWKIDSYKANVQLEEKVQKMLERHKNSAIFIINNDGSFQLQMQGNAKLGTWTVKGKKICISMADGKEDCRQVVKADKNTMSLLYTPEPGAMVEISYIKVE